MPFNGTGVFNRLMNWTQDAANGIFVRADRMDTDSNDFAAAFSLCLTRDGQSSPTGPISWGNQNLLAVNNFTAQSGSLLGATPANNNNGQLIATTAYVQNQVGAVSTLAAAATVAIGAANPTVNITGNTAITAFDSCPAGVRRWLFFSGNTTLTYNATSLITETGANISTIPGDHCIAESLGSGNWKIYLYVSPNAVVQSVYGITGFLPSSIAGTNTTASLTVSGGIALDSTNAATIIIAGNTSWAVSNGNAINGYSGGSTLPNSSTIHFFVCRGTSGSGIFASNSLTPTFPTGYNTYTKRVFSLLTNSSGALLPGTSVEIGGGAQLFYLTTVVVDANGAATTTASRTLYALSVPQGLKVQPVLRITGPGQTSYIITSPDETDSTTGTAGLVDISGNTQYAGSVSTPLLTTNTSAQIGVRTSLATTVNIGTRGWIDFRR